MLLELHAPAVTHRPSAGTCNFSKNLGSASCPRRVVILAYGSESFQILISQMLG